MQEYTVEGKVCYLVKDVARCLGITRQGVHFLINNGSVVGKLPAIKIGHTLFVIKDELARYPFVNNGRKILYVKHLNLETEQLEGCPYCSKGEVCDKLGGTLNDFIRTSAKTLRKI